MSFFKLFQHRHRDKVRGPALSPVLFICFINDIIHNTNDDYGEPLTINAITCYICRAVYSCMLIHIYEVFQIYVKYVKNHLNSILIIWPLWEFESLI